MSDGRHRLLRARRAVIAIFDREIVTTVRLVYLKGDENAESRAACRHPP